MGAARSFKQRDMTRAMKAAQAAGIEPHVWVDKDGSLHVAPANDLTRPPSATPSDERNPWDDLLI